MGLVAACYAPATDNTTLHVQRVCGCTSVGRINCSRDSLTIPMPAVQQCSDAGLDNSRVNGTARSLCADRPHMRGPSLFVCCHATNLKSKTTRCVSVGVMMSMQFEPGLCCARQDVLEPSWQHFLSTYSRCSPQTCGYMCCDVLKHTAKGMVVMQRQVHYSTCCYELPLN